MTSIFGLIFIVAVGSLVLAMIYMVVKAMATVLKDDAVQKFIGYTILVVICIMALFGFLRGCQHYDPDNTDIDHRGSIN